MPGTLYCKYASRAGYPFLARFRRSGRPVFLGRDAGPRRPGDRAHARVLRHREHHPERSGHPLAATGTGCPGQASRHRHRGRARRGRRRPGARVGRADPAERDEFTRLFAELLERGLVARLAGTVNPVNGILMTWQGETRVNDEARVATVVESRDGRKIIVVYRMTERRGRWLVRDVVVDGISTTDNYRSQFKRVLRQGSYATLVAQLRAKLGEETLMFAQASPVPKPVEAAATTRPSPAPRVVARAPAHPPAARATAPPVARAGLPSVAKATAPSVAKAAAPSVARTAAPSVAKTAAPSVARAAAPTTPPVAAAPTPPANETRVALVAMTPVVLPPTADDGSHLSLAARSTDMLQ